ncbi:LiaI-LiaF-like domain-containing protein [Undibacterium sp.]|uniref:LiaI-LiaF-like domain-containing protein n=1 Tax=Undibacterium sp. TaxID=1914977 RepID=UPI00374D3121
MSDQLQQTDKQSRREARRNRRGADYDVRQHLVWGVTLIAIGFIFLCDRLDLIDMDVQALWHLWPAALGVYGVADIVFAKRPAHVLKGVYHIALAFWLYACLENLWGWTFGNTWPMILIAWGISVLLRGTPYLSEDAKTAKEESAK